MIAILSTTDNPLYDFFIPFVTSSWSYKDIRTLVISVNNPHYESTEMVLFENVFTTKNKEATYSQCSRLFGYLHPDIGEEETVVTGDIDMAYFGDIVKDEPSIHIYGADLVNEGQFPICYVTMSKANWRIVMGNHESIQIALDDLLDGHECENMRGNLWCRDQETIYNNIIKSGLPYTLHDRRKSDTNRTAKNRADRDGWQYDVNGLVDAHLPRPGYEPENFAKILKLFKDVYPQENFDWMVEYRNLFVSLL